MPSIERRALLAASAASIAAAAPAEAAEAIVLTEYWAAKQRGGAEIRLAMYRKRIGDAARPVLFLVHGSSTSARSSFDLSVPGHDDYSMMDAFARYGFDVWTMDHEGYGRSARTDGNSDIASGVEDLKAAMAVVARETGQTRCHFLGKSSGALRAAAFAVAAPEHAGRLVLAAHTYTGKGSPTLAKRAEQVEYYRTHNTRLRDRAMIESIFTRDQARHHRSRGAQGAGGCRNGVWRTGSDRHLSRYDGESAGGRSGEDPLAGRWWCAANIDGIATMEDLWDFFRQLPSGDKQFSVIAGAAHALATCKNRHAFWHVAQAFLTMPEPPAADMLVAPAVTVGDRGALRHEHGCRVGTGNELQKQDFGGRHRAQQADREQQTPARSGWRPRSAVSPSHAKSCVLHSWRLPQNCFGIVRHRTANRCDPFR